MPLDVKSLIVSSLVVALIGLLKVILSEKVLGKILLILLRHLAKKTTNTLDDEIIKAVEDGLNSKE